MTFYNVSGPNTQCLLTSLALLRLLNLLPLLLLVPLPLGPVRRVPEDPLRVPGVLLQQLVELLRRDEDLGVLLEQLGEVLEEGMLRAEKVELVVALLAVHQASETGQSASRRPWAVKIKNTCFEDLNSFRFVKVRRIFQPKFDEVSNKKQKNEDKR